MGYRNPPKDKIVIETKMIRKGEARKVKTLNGKIQEVYNTEKGEWEKYDPNASYTSPPRIPIIEEEEPKVLDPHDNQKSEEQPNKEQPNNAVITPKHVDEYEKIMLMPDDQFQKEIGSMSDNGLERYFKKLLLSSWEKGNIRGRRASLNAQLSANEPEILIPPKTESLEIPKTEPQKLDQKIEAPDVPKTDSLDVPKIEDVTKTESLEIPKTEPQKLDQKIEAPDVPKTESLEVKTEPQNIETEKKAEQIEIPDVPKIETPEAPKIESIDLQKVETQNVELQKVESPKVELQKVESPKVELQKVESPKVELQKVESPKVELQKIEPLEITKSIPKILESPKTKSLEIPKIDQKDIQKVPEMPIPGVQRQLLDRLNDAIGEKDININMAKTANIEPQKAETKAEALKIKSKNKQKEAKLTMADDETIQPSDERKFEEWLKKHKFQENVEKMTELAAENQEEIEGISTEITNVKGEIGNVKGDIGGVKEDIGGVKEDIGSVRGDIGTVRGDLKSLEDRLHDRLGPMKRPVSEALGELCTGVDCIKGDIKRSQESQQMLESKMNQRFEQLSDKLKTLEEPTFVCDNCGADGIKPLSSFCPNCGAPIHSWNDETGQPVKGWVPYWKRVPNLQT